MGKLPIDLRTSTQWGIANVKTKGVVGMNEVIFDLVNVHTVRAHRLKVLAGGIDVGPLPVTYSPSSSMSNYSYFTTRHPVNFDDFDGVGARLISGSALFYSWSSLTLWEHKAYVSNGLAWVRMSGWGVSVPGAGLDHGIASVIYGDGDPLGPVETVIDFNPPPSPEHVDTRVQIQSKDNSFMIVLQGDVLFDFDKSDIKPEAIKPLGQAAAIIRSASRKGSRVMINGYTDSVGTDTYNMGLSERRANAVVQWFASGRYFDASMLQPRGFGKSQPIASNNDDAGRAKNRRIEIYLLNR